MSGYAATVGFDGDVDLIRRIVAADTEAADLLDRALQVQPCRPKTFDNVQGSEAPSGNAKGAPLRRLRKDAPELHAEVVAVHRPLVGRRERRADLPE